MPEIDVVAIIKFLAWMALIVMVVLAVGQGVATLMGGPLDVVSSVKASPFGQVSGSVAQLMSVVMNTHESVGDECPEVDGYAMWIAGLGSVVTLTIIVFGFHMVRALFGGK